MNTPSPEDKVRSRPAPLKFGWWYHFLQGTWWNTWETDSPRVLLSRDTQCLPYETHPSDMEIHPFLVLRDCTILTRKAEHIPFRREGTEPSLKTARSLGGRDGRISDGGGRLAHERDAKLFPLVATNIVAM